MTTGIAIRRAARADAPAWLALRAALWSDDGGLDDIAELEPFFDDGDHAAFVAVDMPSDGVVGLAEASIRRDYVNGTRSSPVGFLEAWSVDAAHRGRGIGRQLVRAVESWCRERGCIELASDSLLDNLDSQRAHAACGFRETERVVYFTRSLA